MGICKGGNELLISKRMKEKLEFQLYSTNVTKLLSTNRRAWEWSASSLT